MPSRCFLLCPSLANTISQLKWIRVPCYYIVYSVNTKYITGARIDGIALFINRLENIRLTKRTCVTIEGNAIYVGVVCSMHIEKRASEKKGGETR